MNGYGHQDYAESLAEFGAPRKLSASGGWILERQIPGFQEFDAMGCYPLFCCKDWARLQDDLDEVGQNLVSLALVADPFGSYDEAHLKRCFSDVVVPFKQAYVLDLTCPTDKIISRNRRKKVKKALKEVYIEICKEPLQFVDQWVDLYANLVDTHTITGIRAFSRTAFARQLNIPGLVMFRAMSQGSMIGATLWFVQGDVGYGHLAAFNEFGYESYASYALDWCAIEHFVGKLRWLYFGPGPGVQGDSSDGLSQYKKRWSTHTRPVYFCGRIFDRKRYDVILEEKKCSSVEDYFPAYRKGEFS